MLTSLSNDIGTLNESLDESVSGLKSAIANEYDASVAYNMGDYVWHNGSLYRSKVNFDVPEAWTSGHWNLLLGTDALKALFNEICKPYDVTRQYLKGEYCRWVGTIRRCKTDTTAGGEPWTAGHWEEVTLDVMNELAMADNAIKSSIAYLQGQIDEINAPDVDTALINRDSWDIEDKRYAHVTYSEKLFSGETLTKQSAQLIEKSFDIRYHNNPYTIHFKTNKTEESTEIRITIPVAFTLDGTQEFDVPIFIPDATNVTSVRFRTSGSGMSKAGDIVPVSGWNKIRFFTEGSGFDGSVNTTLIRFFVYHSAGTDIDVYIGSILQVIPDKGSLIIIDDGPYYSFYTEAYPALKQLGVPVCWAIDPAMLDSNDSATRKLINENELELLATDGLSEFSFHSYDGTVMMNATAQQALADTLNNIHYLKKKSIHPNRIWRAAWLNNACADPSLANLELDASASYEGKSGIAVYPFCDRYNIPRYGLGGRTTSDIDAIFNKLRTEHCVYLLYLHGVSTADRDPDPTLWAYFMTKLEEAINAGYVNPTTYNRLVAYFKEIK